MNCRQYLTVMKNEEKFIITVSSTSLCLLLSTVTLLLVHWLPNRGFTFKKVIHAVVNKLKGYRRVNCESSHQSLISGFLICLFKVTTVSCVFFPTLIMNWIHLYYTITFTLSRLILFTFYSVTVRQFPELCREFLKTANRLRAFIKFYLCISYSPQNPVVWLE